MQLPQNARWATPEEARGWSPQRTENDCFIAATATLLGVPYEAVADALGYPVDPSTGLPSGVGGGFHLLAMAKPLLRHGMGGTLLMMEGVEPSWPAGASVTKEEMAVLLEGQTALILTRNQAPSPHEPRPMRMVAWMHDKVVDCSPNYGGKFLVVDGLEKIAVVAALVIARHAPPARFTTATTSAANDHSGKDAAAPVKASERLLH